MKKTAPIIVAVAGLTCLAIMATFRFVDKMKTSSVDKAYIGKQTPKIENGVFSPEALLALGRISDPQVSPDGDLILYGVSYTDMALNRSCRNLFVCNADGSANSQLTRSGRSISCARWSPDGKKIYYICGGQLYGAPFRGKSLGRAVKLSDVPEGISEFSISPDGRQILYVSTIPGPVKSPKDFFPELGKAQAYVTDDLMYRHWDHWVTSTPRTFVSSLGNGKVTPDNSFDILGSAPEGIELPTEPFGGAEQLDWAPDSRHIAFSCRMLKGKQYAFSTNTCIYIYDVLTGCTTPVTTGGGYDTDPKWSPDGSRLAWISMERDGYEADRQRLMTVEVSFPQAGEGQPSEVKLGAITELTRDFIYDVSGIHWTACGKYILFSSYAEAVGSIFKVGLDGKAPVRMTPVDWKMSLATPFNAVSGEDGCTLYTCADGMTFATELCSVKINPSGDASVKMITDENGHIYSRLDNITYERISIDTPYGGKLPCWVLYPPHFDPSKKYAGIEMFNGGPQTCLEDGWSYRWNFRLMCQQGYVVVLPNRHGDSGFGQEWKEQISGDYQGLNMQDYMAAGKWFKGQPWAGKLAGVGASYGGFSAYNLMGIHGDLFDCFISHAGIFDEKALWYTTEEMWFNNWDNGGLKEYAYEAGKVGPSGDGITFGGMQQAGAPYADVAKSRHHYTWSPDSRVTEWHTPILCMHGMLDFRIPYEQGMAAFNAAQMMGVPSKLVIFPEECHWILKPQNALFWHRTFFDWIDRWTK